VTERTSVSFGMRVFLGFISGFFATLIFHQLMVFLLWTAGMAPAPPFALAPTRPFEVPSVISLSFWGGIWGIVWAFIETSISHRLRYWLGAILFGGILPSLVALLVIFPLKGLHTGGGWPLRLLLMAFLVNGAWGLGTAIFLKAFLSWQGVSENSTGSCGREVKPNQSNVGGP
jgi:hypothetical protein